MPSTDPNCQLVSKAFPEELRDKINLFHVLKFVELARDPIGKFVLHVTSPSEIFLRLATLKRMIGQAEK